MSLSYQFLILVFFIRRIFNNVDRLLKMVELWFLLTSHRYLIFFIISNECELFTVPIKSSSTFGKPIISGYYIIISEFCYIDVNRDFYTIYLQGNISDSF